MSATTTSGGLETLDRPRQDKLRLAASTILEIAEDDLLTSPLEAEPYIFCDRLDAAILRSEEQHSTAK
jgi:hypothetical protein